MPTPTPPRRPRLDLTVSSPAEPEAAVPTTGRIPYLPWLAAAAGWSAAAAVLGLAGVGVLVLAGWLTALRTPPAAVLHTTGQGWLSAHGVAVQLGPVSLHLLPLSLTLALVAALAVVGHHAAVQAADDDLPATPRAVWAAWARVVGACTVVYAAAVGTLAWLVDSPGSALGALLGAVLIALLGSGFGALRGLDLDPLEQAPAWVRRLPAAVGLGLATLSVGAASALAVSVVAHWPRIVAFSEALAPDPVGAVLLVLVQLLYLPSALLWAGSWVLGAGVSLGAGSLASPAATASAALPAIPMLGAIPEQNPAGAWWWLLAGALAGAVAGWVLVRGLPADAHADIEGWPWQGGVAGVVTGVVFALAAVLARGDLGVEQLVGLGPVFPDLLWLATVPLGLAGGAAALGAHALAARRLPPADGAPAADAALPAGEAGDGVRPEALAPVGGPEGEPDRPIG